MVSRSDVAEILVRAGALVPHRQGAAPEGADAEWQPRLDLCRLSTSTSFQRPIVDGLIEAIRHDHARVDLVVSPTISSLPIATLVASALGVPMIYVRQKAKSHGRQRQIEGLVHEGARAALVFDDIADPAALQRTVDVVTRAGVRVTMCATVCVRDPEALREAAQALGIGSAWLTDDQSIAQAIADKRPAGAGVRPGRTESHAERVMIPREETNGESSRHELKRRVAEALLRIGAITITSEKPFRYASGILSPIYTDNRLLISHPEAWDVILRGYTSALAGLSERGRIDALAGLATAGIPHATRIAERLGLPLVYVDSADHEQVFGPLEARMRVAMIEDHVTTGKSVLETAAVLRQHGAQVEDCVAIFTYSTERAREALGRAGVRFTSLCDLDTLLDVATGGGFIGEADRQAVLDWLRDPDAWSRRAEAALPKASA